jgi:hypothetical protein
MTQTLDRALLQACAAQADEIVRGTGGALRHTAPIKVYLAVVELELPASGVRRWLGWRRSDVDAACLEVEDQRERPALDEAIAAAGAALRERVVAAAVTIGREQAPLADLNAQRAARAARRALRLLIEAGGRVVGHEAFGSAETARKAIWAARKAIGPDAIRTVRGRGFRMTEAGLRAARALRLGPFGECRNSSETSRPSNETSQKAAA